MRHSLFSPSIIIIFSILFAGCAQISPTPSEVATATLAPAATDVVVTPSAVAPTEILPSSTPTVTSVPSPEPTMTATATPEAWKNLNLQFPIGKDGKFDWSDKSKYPSLPEGLVNQTNLKEVANAITTACVEKFPAPTGDVNIVSWGVNMYTVKGNDTPLLMEETLFETTKDTTLTPNSKAPMANEVICGMPLSMTDTTTGEKIDMTFMVVRGKTDSGYTYFPVIGTSFDFEGFVDIGKGEWPKFQAFHPDIVHAYQQIVESNPSGNIELYRAKMNAQFPNFGGVTFDTARTEMLDLVYRFYKAQIITDKDLNAMQDHVKQLLAENPTPGLSDLAGQIIFPLHPSVPFLFGLLGFRNTIR